MNNDRYFIKHGDMLYSEHSTFELAIEQSAKIMNEYKQNHSVIKIGDREIAGYNKVVMVCLGEKNYPVEEQQS